MAALDDGAAELLDREPAMREIDALVAEARARGERPILRVAGPPGIGKTAVLATFVKRFHGRTRCVAADAVHQTSGGAVARRLLDLSSGDAIHVNDLRRRLYGLCATLDLLVIDDLQWLDELTLRMLRVILRDDSLKMVLLVADRREDAPELPPHRTLTLPPLRRTAALKLVRRRYPNVSAALAANIADVSGGLPFGLTFLADDAAARAAHCADDAPQSIRGVITTRLVRVSTLARDAARLTALLDPPVEVAVVARALAVTVEILAQALVEIGDLVAFDGRHIGFRHAAIADAVASTVPNVVASYTRLLDALDGDQDVAARLATIVRCALGSGNGERAAEAALRLARTLARDGLLGSALGYAASAVENAHRPLPVEFAVEYAGILNQLARYDKAAAFLRHAIRTAIDNRDALTAAELLASFCGPAISLERFAEIESLCDRVASLHPGTPHVLARIRSVRLSMLAYAGRLDEYLHLAAAEKLNWVDARTFAFVKGLMGDSAAAAEAVNTYVSGLRTQHDRQEPADRLLECTVAFLNTGARALDHLDDLPAGDTRHPSERALRVLARIADGRWDQARTLLAQTDDEDDEADQLLEVRLCFAALTSSSIADEGPLRHLRAMIARGRLRHAIVPARWYLVATDHDSAPDIETFVRDTLLVAPMPYAFTSLPLVFARLEHRLGREPCGAALRMTPAYGSLWHRAHHDLAYGMIHGDNERLRSARDAFDAANYTAFAAIAGIALPVPRARDVAVARRIGILAGRAHRPAQLTPRERDVAELTARGASNREIATALGIAERTVETHLTKVFAKLGVASRSSLAHLLTREP